MKFTTSIFAIAGTAAAVLAIVRPASAQFGDSFTGEGTYYGDIPVGNGNCAMRGNLPSMYSNMIPVAINAPQYDGSKMCGACIEGSGSGNGEGNDPIKGSFKAFVIDQCPECSWGDLDFAESGDGRWDITWKFVACPGGGEPTFQFEGSNPWYWKIQPMGTISPVNELYVNKKLATRTDDNFWIMTEGTPFYGEQLVETKTMMSKSYSEMVTL